jgi:hypothetical protein
MLQIQILALQHLDAVVEGDVLALKMKNERVLVGASA